MSAYQNKVAELHTSAGEIDIRFFPDVAPNHVKNFIDLAEKGFYNGTKFHRIIPGFMDKLAGNGVHLPPQFFQLEPDRAGATPTRPTAFGRTSS